MKILLVSNMFPSKNSPSFGVFVKNIHEQLSNAGLNINKVVISNYHGGKIRKIYSYMFFFLSIFLRIPFYKLFYVHFASHSMIPFVLLSYLGIRPKVICHVHGGDVKLLRGFNQAHFVLKRKIVQRALSISKKIIVPSKSYATFIQEEYSIVAEKLLVYPSGGVNQDNFKLLGIKRDKKLLGYAGRLIKSKNIDIIIQTLVYLPEYYLEIVGDGNQKASLVELVNKLGLTDRVNFLPPINQTELAVWFNKINILVYPSDSESLGLVPIEAMSCGALVVLSAIPPFIELQDLCPHACTVEEKNAETYALAIKKQCELQGQEREIVVEANLDIIRKNFSTVVTFENLKHALS